MAVGREKPENQMKIQNINLIGCFLNTVDRVIQPKILGSKFKISLKAVK